MSSSRPILQLHLLTLAVIVLTAGALLGINSEFRRRTVEEAGLLQHTLPMQHEACGWPYPLFSKGDVVLAQNSPPNMSALFESHWNFEGLAKDIVIAFTIVTIAALISETILRRRQKRA